ncbi:MAG: hypothetical protein Q9169_003544 [Polycauliona sp. 2 TL-2023]
MAGDNFDPSQLSASQKEALGTYTAVTNQEPSAAIALLERSQWNVQIAIAKFFDGEAPDQVEEARAAIASSPAPPPSSSRQETLMNGFSTSPRPSTRARLDAAPRIVPQPEHQTVYRTPFILALILTPFNLIYRILSGSFRLFAYLFPFLPRMLSGLAGSRAQPRPQRDTTGRRPLNAQDTAARFVREFEEEYGQHGLDFYPDGYAQAYDLAKKDLKFLLVVLLSPEHDDTTTFVRGTLLSQEVVNYVNDPQNKIILWAGSVQDSEAYQISTALNCSKFPFAAVVAHTPEDSSTSMSTIVRISGLVPPSTFVARLRAAISNHSTTLAQARASRNEQQATRTLREEQNSAYERSLAQDRERTRQRRDEEEARSHAEREQKAKAEAAKLAARDLEQWRQWRAQSIPAEPSASGEGVTRVSIRMTSGERVVRKFSAESDMEDVYAFVECYDILAGGVAGSNTSAPQGYRHNYRFRLVSPMPRTVHDVAGGSTIGQKVGRSGNLLVESIDDDENEVQTMTRSNKINPPSKSQPVLHMLLEPIDRTMLPIAGLAVVRLMDSNPLLGAVVSHFPGLIDLEGAVKRHAYHALYSVVVQDGAAVPTADPSGDSPEAAVARGIVSSLVEKHVEAVFDRAQRLFCESGGLNNQGEEVLHLPVIVEAAESSPPAAREAANRIRKFLSRDNFQRAYVQYNAIMLVRILADNPGKSFTRNLDNKFASTVKELLRDGRDMSVQQILRETLDSFETGKADDETLAPLRDMWKKEKLKWSKRGTPVTAFPNNVRSTNFQAANNDQNYFARNHHPRGLPPPHELAQRIEEARTSSKLLLQVVQSTPPNEVLTNELIKEFVERCQSASRSIQGYINSEDPPPDENTLLTLIETNDGISTALSRYQRAMLQARRLTTASPSPGPGGLQRNGTLHQEMPVNGPPLISSNGAYDSPSAPPTNGSFSAPPGPPPQQQQAYQGQQTYPPTQPTYPQSRSRADPDDNPFDDPRPGHSPSQAPTDYGLPPAIPPNENASTFQSSGSGYHPTYQSPPPTTTSSADYSVRKEVGSTSEPAQQQRANTYADDSSEDDERYRQGQMRGGQPVKYRF